MTDSGARSGAASGITGGGFADRELALRARRGDTGAFDSIVERHHASIYRLCRALLRERSDAEDATQETFVRAWRCLGRYDATRAFAPWLRGIAANVCRQAVRGHGRREARTIPLETQLSDPPAPEQEELSPVADRALDALQSLDETYRLPLVLFYLREATVADVAEALKISEGAARVRLHRGREMLRQILMAEQDNVET